MGSWTGLAEAVALFNSDLDTGIDRLHEFLGEWSSAGVHHPQAGQVILVDNWVFAEQENDWRNDVTKSDAIVLDMGAPSFNVKLLHNDQLVPGV